MSDASDYEGKRTFSTMDLSQPQTKKQLVQVILLGDSGVGKCVYSLLFFLFYSYSCITIYIASCSFVTVCGVLKVYIEVYIY